MKTSTTKFVWLFSALIVIVAGSQVEAQTGSAGKPVNVRGKITAVKAQELSVVAPNGEVRVTVSEKTIIRQEIAMQLSDIAPGMYLGTTAEKQAACLFRAS